MTPPCRRKERVLAEARRGGEHTEEYAVPEQKYFTISSLEKAFSVIELMTHKSKWDLRELASVSDLPKGTLQRILLTLMEMGYVHQKHRGGAYELTLKFFQLGRRIVGNNNIVENARPYCRAMLDAVNETVNLCMASGTDMVVLDQHLSRHHLRLDSVVGSSFPIYQSASGKAWMAFQPEEEMMATLARIQRTRPPLSSVEMDTLMSELADVRNEGIAFDYEEIFPGVRCVSAPIFDYSENLVATLSCSVPVVRITPELSSLLIQQIRDRARDISVKMGAAPRAFRSVTHSMADGEVPVVSPA